LTPHVQEHVADQILRRRRIADEAKQEPIHAHLMAGEQNLHRKPVALGDPADQDFI
jgi:hypothetical protein